MMYYFSVKSIKKYVFLPYFIVLLIFVSAFITGCVNKEPTLKYGVYKSASGMEVKLKEDTLEVNNYDFSADEKSHVEFEYNYQFSEYGLAEGEKERTLEEIDDATNMNEQFIGKTVSYTTQIEGENKEKIGIYCTINGVTTWFYLEYFPSTNSLIYTSMNGDTINLKFQGEI